MIGREADVMAESPPPMASRTLSRHDESTAFVPATPARLFAHVDDHARLSSHMNTSSSSIPVGSPSVAISRATDAG